MRESDTSYFISTRTGTPTNSLLIFLYKARIRAGNKDELPGFFWLFFFFFFFWCLGIFWWCKPFPVSRVLQLAACLTLPLFHGEHLLVRMTSLLTGGSLQLCSLKMFKWPNLWLILLLIFNFIFSCPSGCIHTIIQIVINDGLRACCVWSTVLGPVIQPWIKGCHHFWNLLCSWKK